MKLRHSTTVCAAVFLALFFILVSVSPVLSYMGTSMLRCGSEIIQLGDSTFMVKQRCGQPAEEKVIGTVSSGSYGGDRRGGSYQESNVQTTILIYDCGSNDFIYKLTFLGDSLAGIEYLGRGSGPNTCR